MGKLGFEIDPPEDDIRCIRWNEGGCRPTSGAELTMWDELTALQLQLAEARAERDAAIETRFWSIVDQHGPSGLPSDMWDALDRLVQRDRRLMNDLQAHKDALAQVTKEQTDAG